MKVNVKVLNANEVRKELDKVVKKMKAEKIVTVGYHLDSKKHKDTDMSMAQLAAIQEYGAEIPHTGGTKYGYKSKAAKNRGEVTFLSNSSKNSRMIVLGVTPPHIIPIPARPFLQKGVDAGIPKYINDAKASIKKGLSLIKILHRIGNLAVSSVQQYMTALSQPPNSPITIRLKGSSNPLIDSGQLKQSVRYKVERQAGID